MEDQDRLSAATKSALDVMALMWGGFCYMLNLLLKRV